MFVKKGRFISAIVFVPAFTHCTIFLHSVFLVGSYCTLYTILIILITSTSSFYCAASF